MFIAPQATFTNDRFPRSKQAFTPVVVVVRYPARLLRRLDED